jgi:DNA-binding transcriptional LysR family regulator
VAHPDGLDWNDLRYFLAAARARSLAGAARALGVEHSTIGRRLTALEEGLGAPLLTRSPDGLKLTALGETMLPLAEQAERAISAVKDAAAGQVTRVRLATPSGWGRIIAPHLAAFQAAHPQVSIDLISGSRLVDLKKSEADLAIRQGTADDPDLISKKLGETGWSLYAADSYLARHPAPSDPRQLVGHEVLGFDDTLAGVPGAQWLDQHGAGAHIVMRCRELADVLAACVAGIGLALLPCMAAELEPSLRRLTKEVLGTRRISLVYRKEVLLSEPIKAVIQFVTDVMAGYADRMSGQESPPPGPREGLPA